MYTVNIRAVGDWRGANAMFRNFSRDIKRAFKSSQENVAKKLLRKVKGHLKKQDLGWVPLSQKTIDRKGHAIALIDSGAYYRSIKFWQVSYTVYVGVRRGVLNSDGNEIARIAVWQEYGTRYIPARPLWRPSIEEIGGPVGMRNDVQRSMYWKLRKMGYKVRYRPNYGFHII